LSWLRRLRARTKGAFWVLVALVVGPPLLLMLMVMVSLATDMRIDVDLGLLAIALVAGGAVLGLVHLGRYWTRPRETVSITYDMKLEQPLMPMGRYAFHLSIYYETEEKGRRRQVRQGEIVMRFKGKDHPDLLAWCCTQVQQHLERHRDKAAELHPRAAIVVSPAPEPAQVAERTVDVGSAG